MFEEELKETSLSDDDVLIDGGLLSRIEEIAGNLCCENDIKFALYYENELYYLIVKMGEFGEMVVPPHLFRLTIN